VVFVVLTSVLIYPNPKWCRVGLCRMIGLLERIWAESLGSSVA
jgi:hypothetical protein